MFVTSVFLTPDDGALLARPPVDGYLAFGHMHTRICEECVLFECESRSVTYQQENSIVRGPKGSTRAL